MRVSQVQARHRRAYLCKPGFVVRIWARRGVAWLLQIALVCVALQLSSDGGGVQKSAFFERVALWCGQGHLVWHQRVEGAEKVERVAIS